MCYTETKPVLPAVEKATKLKQVEIMEENKHIWEGWHVSDFIESLEVTFPYQKFKSKEDVRKWCKDEQPYYKKHIPEVANHFIKKAKLNTNLN